MEVTYTLTNDDLPKYVREYSAWYSKTPRKQTWVEKFDYYKRYSLIVVLPLLLSSYLTLTHRNSNWPFITIVVYGLSLRIFLPYIYIWNAVKRLASFPDMLKPRYLRIDTDGVFGKETNAEWKVYWASIGSVAWTKTFVWIMFEDQMMRAIPKVAFTDEQQAVNFYHEAIDLRTQALAADAGAGTQT